MKYEEPIMEIIEIDKEALTWLDSANQQEGVPSDFNQS